MLTIPTTSGSARYALALAAVLAAHGLAAMLRPVLDLAPFPLFLIAVVLAARLGGMGPALGATVSSTLLLDYFFLLPVHTFAIASLHAALDLALFALAAVMVSRWTSTLDAARRDAAAARTEAVGRAQDLAAVVEAADDGVVVFAADGQIKHTNGWFRAWWLVHLGEVPATTDALLAALRTAAPGTSTANHLLPINLALRGLHASEVLTLHTREGDRRVRMRAAPIFDERGVARGAVALWHDLTELPEARPWVRVRRPSALASQN